MEDDDDVTRDGINLGLATWADRSLLHTPARHTGQVWIVSAASSHEQKKKKAKESSRVINGRAGQSKARHNELFVLMGAGG